MTNFFPALFFKAKFQSSLKWLFTKAYSTSIPVELQEPFFEENELGKSLRDDILHELIKGRVYCLAYRNILSFPNLASGSSKTSANNSANNINSVDDVIQHLTKNAIEVHDENDDLITSQIIAKDSPFYVVRVFFKRQSRDQLRDIAFFFFVDCTFGLDRQPSNSVLDSSYALGKRASFYQVSKHKWLTAQAVEQA